jgi:hypothetical protein
MRTREAVLAMALGLAGARLIAGGSGSEELTPGWDSFPGLTSGSVDWSVGAGSTTFRATFALDGAAPNQDHLVGVHHFDVGDWIPDLGAGTSETGDGPPQETTREGNTSRISNDEFGFVATDGNGDTETLFTLVGVNPGVYAVQFHVREGGAPGCPATNCNAIYRTGGVFAGDLVRFAVPGAAAFWSGDGHLADEVGANAAEEVGAVGYRSGHFRQGFDLDGTSYLSVPDPGTGGLAFVDGFTVSAWIVQDAFSSTASVINLRTPANRSGFALEPLFQTPGSFAVGVNTSGEVFDFATVSAAGFPTGVPIWVAASFDAASHTLRLYRNGSLVGERTDVPNAGISYLGTEAMEIGRNVVTGAKFDGLLDELLYFDRALAPDELRALGGVLFADGFEESTSGEWSATVGG